MGYTTYFDGAFQFDKPVTDELKTYINKFSDTRRMLRDNNKIKELFPNWRELCFNGELGENGAYFIGGDIIYFGGNREDKSIINYNDAGSQPGLWCQWVINDNNELMWDQGEKFYNYTEWLEYLIEHFFAPSGYVLNGTVFYEGEDSDDFGKIVVTDNIVKLFYGYREYEEAN
jgi:hypothetical protein